MNSTNEKYKVKTAVYTYRVAQEIGRHELMRHYLSS